jgi:hypothetical protein
MGGGIVSTTTTLYRLRVRDDADGYYRNQRGKRMGRPFDTRDEAEDVRRHMPNGAEFEVVEVEE